MKCTWKGILAKSEVFQIFDIAKSGTLTGQHMCSVLRGGGFGGESVTVAVGVVVLLSSGIPIIQHYSHLLA